MPSWSPPPPPADGNYPPPPPMPMHDACPSDSFCAPLSCPSGQAGYCRFNQAVGIRTCMCDAAEAGISNLEPPISIAPAPPALGGQSRCWTNDADPSRTMHTAGFPGRGWTLGCAPAPPPPLPAAGTGAANGARCGGFMEGNTLSPRCACGDGACTWSGRGWACACPPAPVPPAPAPSNPLQALCASAKLPALSRHGFAQRLTPALFRSAGMACVEAGKYYTQDGQCVSDTSRMPSDSFRMCHDYGRGRTVECCQSLALPVRPSLLLI